MACKGLKTFIFPSPCKVKPLSGINMAIGLRIRNHIKPMTDSSGSPPPSELNEDELRAELQQLRIEHKDISDAVEALEAIGQADQLQIRRFKRRKLLLKDRIRQIEDQLTPDIIA
jgi:hypothetical protein